MGRTTTRVLLLDITLRVMSVYIQGHCISISFVCS